MRKGWIMSERDVNENANGVFCVEPALSFSFRGGSAIVKALQIDGVWRWETSLNTTVFGWSSPLSRTSPSATSREDAIARGLTKIALMLMRESERGGYPAQANHALAAVNEEIKKHVASITAGRQATLF